MATVVGATVSAAGSGSDVLDELVAEMVAVPSIGREGMRDRIRSSKTDNLSFTISILSLLLISPACSIIGDEADGRAEALTGSCLRGGREDERLLLLLLLFDILSVVR